METAQNPTASEGGRNLSSHSGSGLSDSNGDFLKRIEFFEAGFYGLGLSVILLTDKPVLDFPHCLNLIWVLAFLAFDGVLKHFLRRQLFPHSDLPLKPKQLVAILSLLAIEVCALLFYSFWAGSFVWNQNSDQKFEWQLFGTFCFLSAVFNFVCVWFMESANNRSTPSSAASRLGKIPLLGTAVSYLVLVLVKDVREWELLRDSNKLWVGFLKTIEQRAVEKMKARKSNGTSMVAAHDNDAWEIQLKMILPRFCLHFLMQVSAMHCLLFNSLFALALWASTMITPHVAGFIGAWGELEVAWIGPNSPRWKFLVCFLGITAVGVRAYWRSIRLELRRTDAEKQTTSEKVFQAVGNCSMAIGFVLILLRYNDSLVMVAILTQAFIMLIMAAGTFSQLVYKPAEIQKLP